MVSIRHIGDIRDICDVRDAEDMEDIWDVGGTCDIGDKWVTKDMRDRGVYITHGI